MKKLLLCALLSSLASACAADSGSAALEDTPLAGTVGGKTWTFVAGDTDAFLSKDEPDFFATLYPATFTACGFSQPAGDHLILSIPKTPGEYPMSLSRNMTFVVGNDNKIAVDGTIVVDEVTATSIKGGIVASFDSANEVNGRFEIPICAE
jgi:hypothetical protein